MNSRRILLLVRFYFLFILRRVLNRGVLRTTGGKVAIGAIAVSTLGLLTFIAYFFLQRTTGDTHVLSLLLNLSSLSAVLWVFVAFIFTKVLFVKSERMLTFTYHLPVTGRQRAIALIIFEMLMVLLTLAVLFTSSVLPIILIHGARALLPIVWALVLPVATVYLLLNAAYSLASRLLSWIGLGRARTLILLVVTSFLAALYYGSLTANTVVIANSYNNGKAPFRIPLAYTFLAREYGGYASLGVFAALASISVLVALATVPRTYVPSQRNLPIPLGALLRLPLVGPQLAMHVRSTDWMLAAFLAIALGALCVGTGLAPAPLACGLLVLNGLGTYGAVSHNRWLLSPLSRRSPIREYAALIGAQALAVTPILWGLTGAALLTTHDSTAQLTAAGSIYLAIPVVNAVGILFPPEQDNPFAMAVGIGVLLALGILAVLSAAVFSLEGVTLASAGLIALLFLIVVSVIGISINTQRSRHEESNQRGDLSPRGRDSHPHHHGGRNSVRNVQHVRG